MQDYSLALARLRLLVARKFEMELDIEKMSATELWEYAESLHDNGDYEQAAKHSKKLRRNKK